MRPSSGFISGYAAPTQDTATGVQTLRDSFPWQAANSYPARDPSFSSVALLLHGEGSNGSTTITDSSSSARSCTAIGTAAISTTQKKWGAASISIPSGTSAIGIPHATAFNLGTQAFTLDAWVYFNSVAQGQSLFYNGFSGLSWALYTNAASSLAVYLSSDNTSWNVANQQLQTPIQVGRWYHVAFQRSGSTFSLYLNGLRTGTITSSATIYYPGSAPTYSWYVGGASGSANCYYDEVRFTAGVARYSGASLTVPNGAFPDR